ncbi:MAG TPA: LPS assembly lipoprotein LptE [Steroidobacteraceae bacterium]|nr:LPS assembly lipoprotein LptE [Steroidobacteraceae bacterium]
MSGLGVGGSSWRCGAVGSLAAALLASGCGFHLEGHTPLPKPLKVAYVDAKNQQSDFVQGLRKALLIAGARVTDDETQATAVVHVLEDAVTPRVLAVSPTDLPREYEITYTVRISVTAGEKDLLTPQELSRVRDYAFDEYVLLAKDNEEDILRQALAQDLVDVVMRRLSSL